MSNQAKHPYNKQTKWAGGIFDWSDYLGSILA